MREDYKRELERREAIWEYRRRTVFPFFRDVISLGMGFGFLAALILLKVSEPWPYIIVAGLCGFPGWMRLVVPLIGGAANITVKAAEALEAASEEEDGGER